MRAHSVSGASATHDRCQRTDELEIVPRLFLWGCGGCGENGGCAELDMSLFPRHTKTWQGSGTIGICSVPKQEDASSLTLGLSLFGEGG